MAAIYPDYTGTSTGSGIYNVYTLSNTLSSTTGSTGSTDATVGQCATIWIDEPNPEPRVEVEHAYIAAIINDNFDTSIDLPKELGVPPCVGWSKSPPRCRSPPAYRGPAPPIIRVTQ